MGTQPTDILFQRFGQYFQAGDVIFREGEQGNEMYIMQKGKVRISRKAGQVEKTLSVLTDNEFFGEMSLLNDKKRSATATVLEPSKILVINRQSFENLIRHNTGFALRMISRLSERLREADKQIEELITYDKKARVIFRAFSLLQKQENLTDQALRFKEMAGEISGQAGIPLAEVHNLLQEMINSGILRLTPQQTLEVKNRRRLNELIDFYLEKSGTLSGEKSGPSI